MATYLHRKRKWFSTILTHKIEAFIHRKRTFSDIRRKWDFPVIGLAFVRPKFGQKCLFRTTMRAAKLEFLQKITLLGSWGLKSLSSCLMS